MKQNLTRALLGALERAQAAGDLPQAEAPAFVVEEPNIAEHGDLASNLAMQLAKPCRMNPRAIAEVLIKHLGNAGGLITRSEIAGPGFINFFLDPQAWLSTIVQVLAQGDDYGRGQWGEGRPVMVEFVSANPTGPLHVGHGRGAVLGDALARLLEYSGYKVHREYYINDAGNQMATLGRSILVRARQQAGSGEPFPDNHYRGDYIGDLAAELVTLPEGKGLLDQPADEAAARASAWGGERILNGIKADLAEIRVSFDNWYSESSLVTGGAVQRALDELRKLGLIYEADGAVWFKAGELGDEKDRVVVRSNGEITYFASDIAYHLEKYQRGFERLVDVWGADHHGYVPRIKAAVGAAGRDPETFQVVLVQMVNLLRGGQPVSMSTRGGEFVTLREVYEEVGVDSTRFLFLTRRSDAPLDFDLDVAKAQSMDNPVYYVQYAHTRVKSVMRKAAEAGISPPAPDQVDLSLLGLKEEVDLARRLAEFPEVIAASARALEPHRLPYYLGQLAGQFHSYYHKEKVLVEDAALAGARMLLLAAVGRVLALGLGVLGVSAPEAM